MGNSLDQLGALSEKLASLYQEEVQKNKQQKLEVEKLREQNIELQSELSETQLQLQYLTDVVEVLQQECKQEKEGHQKTKRDMKEIVARHERNWKISHRDIILLEKELGKGAWAGVTVGVFREQRVAVKQIHDLIVDDASLAIMEREIFTMSCLRHPNLLLFIGAVLDHPSKKPLLVTEIMDTSLRNAYEKRQLTGGGVRLSVLRDTAAGLNYLHCHPDKIIHRDVSSANVLLESRGPNKWRAKLSDFGSANVSREAVTPHAGSAVYSAPESMVSLLDDKAPLQTTKMDVYSYGIMVCEVMTGQFPNSADTFHSMLQKVLSSNYPSVGGLIKQCIDKDPDIRPTMAEVTRTLNELLM